MLDAHLVGRTYPPTAPYEVSREKIREFAVALGDLNPIYFEAGAARAAGYRDVVAPPTFAIVISQPAAKAATFDPELGIDYTRVVHGAQRFTHHRPLIAGDVVTATTVITEARPAGPHELLATETTLVVDEESVCVAHATLIVRSDAT